MKKTLSLILSFIMVITAFSGFSITADAAADYTVLASDLSINSGWSGEKWLTEGNTEAWYRITIPGDGKFTFKAMAYMFELNLYLYNSDLSTTIFGKYGFCWSGNETAPATNSFYKVLSPGTYYLKIDGDEGLYFFSWNALTPENCTHEFETTTVDPTCTEQGYKKHTCKICGYSYNDEYKDGSHNFYREVVGATYLSKGYTRYTCRNCKTTYTDNYTAKLKLDKPSISSIKKGKKKLTVNLSANYYRYDGVQVQYSTSKKFAKKSTKTVSTSKYSKVLKKLKGKKKYYVRVRAYKVVDGKKVYSGWSKTKSAKTK